MQSASAPVRTPAPPPLTRKRLLLADDHQIFLEGLERLLQSDFDVVGTASSGDALVDLAKDLDPDVVVTDYSMPGLTGIEALDALRAEGLGAKVIILTMHEDAEYASEAIEKGVQGYVLKRAAASELLAALRSASVPDSACMEISSVIRRPSKPISVRIVLITFCESVAGALSMS